MLIKRNPLKYVPHYLPVNYWVAKMCAHGSQWISHKINIRQPGQLKKLKPWRLFWSYQLNCTANSANMANFCCKWANEWTKNLSNFFDKSVDKKAFLKITNLYAPTFPNHSYYIYSLYKRDKRCQIGIQIFLKSAY